MILAYRNLNNSLANTTNKEMTVMSVQNSVSNASKNLFLVLYKLLDKNIPKVKSFGFKDSIKVFDWYISKSVARKTLESYLKDAKAVSEKTELLEAQVEALLNALLVTTKGIIPEPFKRFAVSVGCRNRSNMVLEDGIYVSHNAFVLVYGEKFFLCSDCLSDTGLDSYWNLNGTSSKTALKGFNMTLEAGLEAIVLFRFNQNLNLSMKKAHKLLTTSDFGSYNGYRLKVNFVALAHELAEDKEDFASFEVSEVAPSDSDLSKSSVAPFRGKNLLGAHMVLESNGLTANWIKTSVDQIFSRNTDKLVIASEIMELIDMNTQFVANWRTNYFK